jgi:hypothetical protein
MTPSMRAMSQDACPHQGLQQEPPLRQPGHAVDIAARIERRRVVSGLISEYCRAA